MSWEVPRENGEETLKTQSPIDEEESRREEREDRADDDVIRTTVGDFGRWQCKVSVLLSLVKLPVAWFQMSIVFLAPPATFWCKQGAISEVGLQQLGLNRGFCPTNRSLDACLDYGFNNSIHFTSTITSEWNLVCNRARLVDLSQVSLMLGVLLGNILFGVLADKHGRTKVLLACLVAQSLFGTVASLSPYFWLFVLLRFLLAMANGGTMVTSFVLCMEIVSGKWRTIVAILYQIPFGLGYGLLSVIAYYSREWRHFHLAISLLSMLYVTLFWFVPESPRWLLVMGRHKDATLILKRARRENKLDDKSVLDNVVRRKHDTSRINIKSLFATRKLGRRNCLICANWLIAGTIFFAFVQHIGHVGENLFVTVALGGFVSLPGTLLCVFLVNNYGRKTTISASYLVTAASSLIIITIKKGLFYLDWPRLLFAGTGIIGLSVSIPAMYLFTGELFPTVLRNSGMGLAMMSSRLGSMLAPLLIALQAYNASLPLLLIGLLTLVQMVLVLPLPETKLERLPDTIEDL